MALDPISTGKIEELIFQLKERLTIVIVTTTCSRRRGGGVHRILSPGQTNRVRQDGKDFYYPSDKRMEGNITGRFGDRRETFSAGTWTIFGHVFRMGGLAEQAVDRACQAYISAT